MKKNVCYHPELFPTQWGQEKPAPAEMVGCCEINQCCPVCGYGWAVYPHECVKEKDEVTHEKFFGENINRIKEQLK